MFGIPAEHGPRFPDREPGWNKIQPKKPFHKQMRSMPCKALTSFVCERASSVGFCSNPAHGQGNEGRVPRVFRTFGRAVRPVTSSNYFGPENRRDGRTVYPSLCFSNQPSVAARIVKSSIQYPDLNISPGTERMKACDFLGGSRRR